MSEIRVTFSGLVSFIIGLGSLVTGLIFTLIVTRRLTPEEFGEWGLIGSLTGYVLMFSPLISYWNTREIARGVDSGKTSLQSSLLFSFGAILVYLIIAKTVGSTINIDFSVLFLALIIIPVEFIKRNLTSITLGFKPQSAEYGLLSFELTKIPIGLALIYFLDMGIEGVIITTTLASMSSIIILLITAREKIQGKFQTKYVKKWVKLVWLPLYPRISSIFERSEVTAFTIISGSLTGLAYWTAANSISHMVNHSGKINKALYPKLLAGGKKEFFQENLVRVLFFAFPLTAMTIVFAKPGLFLLNPLYEIAVLVVLSVIPLTFLRTMQNIFSQALSGIEKVDTSEKSMFIDYVKSKLFVLPTLVNIQRGISLLSLIILLFILLQYGSTELELVIAWGIISSITQFPFTVYLGILVNREFHPKIDYITIIKYLVSTIVIFTFTYFIMNELLFYEKEIFIFLPSFIPFLVCPVIGYIGLTYLIDYKTRKLVKLVFNELKKKK
jgi:O-antigen/teichoic acid export membrane protein